MVVAALLYFLVGCFPGPDACQELAEKYGKMDAAGVRDLLRSTGSSEERFMVLYRLYPLVQDGSLLDDLPDELEDGASAREAALLAALWSYRYNHGPFWSRMNAVRRAFRLMDEAKRMDPNEPFVLLVDGQSLLYRPKFAGGDASAARRLFEALRRSVERRQACSLSLVEVDTWIWLSMRRQHDPEADAFRQKILATNPLPVYREFLKLPK